MSFTPLSPRTAERDWVANIRRGFSLAEVLVALLIIALLAAVTIPTFMGRITSGEGQALAAELGALGDGIRRYQENVGNYPPRLDYLAVLPATPTDFCSPAAALSNREKAGWRGPYVTRNIPTPTVAPAPPVFYVVNNDTINITLVRTPTVPNSAVRNFIEISVIALDSTKAAVVEESIDGGTLNYADGNVTWIRSTIPGAIPVLGTLRYRVPVAGC